MELASMLPGFRFLFTAIVLSMSVLIFGLGAAALLRAAHEEFANLPSRRATPEPMFARLNDDPPPTLALLRVDPPVAREAGGRLAWRRSGNQCAARPSPVQETAWRRDARQSRDRSGGATAGRKQLQSSREQRRPPEMPATARAPGEAREPAAAATNPFAGRRAPTR